jgi:hypothetical protein
MELVLPWEVPRALEADKYRRRQLPLDGEGAGMELGRKEPPGWVGRGKGTRGAQGSWEKEATGPRRIKGWDVISK